MSERSLCLSYRGSNTRRRHNAGLLLAHRLRRWANTQYYYRVVFDATLNVGQRHRLRANINPAFVQSIVGYYSHHEVGLLTKVEWILASNVRLAQHLTDIGSVSACTARPHPSKHEALNQCWFYAGPAWQTLGQNWTSIESTSRVCWECWQATFVFCTSPAVKILKLLPNWLRLKTI